MKHSILALFLLAAGHLAAQSYLTPSLSLTRQLHEPAGTADYRPLDRLTGEVAYTIWLRTGVLSGALLLNRSAQQISQGDISLRSEWEYLTLRAGWGFRLPVPDPAAAAVTFGPQLYTAYLLDKDATRHWDHGAGLAVSFQQQGMHITIAYLHGLLGLSETTRNELLLVSWGVPLRL